MQATFHYPKFLMTYESRTANPLPLFGRNQGAGTDDPRHRGHHLRQPQRLLADPATRSRSSSRRRWEKDREMAQMNVPHWKNWLECIKTPREADQRDRDLRALLDGLPAGESLDAPQDALDWDEKNWTVKQDAVQALSEGALPQPWKLEV